MARKKTIDEQIKTINALLRKAEDAAATEPERELARQQAEKLMVKHEVDQAQLQAESGTATGEKIISVRLNFTGTYANANCVFTTIIAHRMSGGNIKVYQFNTGRGRRAIMLVGYETDLMRAQLLISSLMLQAAIELDAWWNGDESPKARIRTSGKKTQARWNFTTSFASAAGDRLQAARRGAVQEAGTGTDLVLADRGVKVQAFCAELDANSRKVSSTPQYSFSEAGYRAGLSAVLDTDGKKQVSDKSSTTAVNS